MSTGGSATRSAPTRAGLGWPDASPAPSPGLGWPPDEPSPATPGAPAGEETP